MTPLTKEYLEQCPEDDGFRLRGMEMTRIEVFVDAAFAFAVTMLVISFDHIPETWDEIIVAIKSIPAFVFSVAQLVWIWYVHSMWSKRYGLENAVTVLLSAALLIIMLIYIYPLRIMMGGFFYWITNGYLPSGFLIDSFDVLSGMFVFMGVGFFCMSVIIVLMYRYARSLGTQLRLNEYETFETRTFELLWLGIGSAGLICAILAVSLPDQYVPFSGFALALISPIVFMIRTRRDKLRKSLFEPAGA